MTQDREPLTDVLYQGAPLTDREMAMLRCGIVIGSEAGLTTFRGCQVGTHMDAVRARQLACTADGLSVPHPAQAEVDFIRSFHDRVIGTPIPDAGRIVPAGAIPMRRRP